VYYLQARDFDQERNLSSNLVPTLSYESSLEKHFLQKGDVLIVAKGSSFLTAVYNATLVPAVASTVFLVIRIKNQSKLNPNFLSWFLNLQTTQTILHGMSRGTSTPSINKKVLAEIEIPVPAIEKQELVLKLNELTRKEKILERTISELKENRKQRIILNAINNLHGKENDVSRREQSSMESM
jgi:restriction endonuclease S subunit